MLMQARLHTGAIISDVPEHHQQHPCGILAMLRMQRRKAETRVRAFVRMIVCVHLCVCASRKPTIVV